METQLDQVNAVKTVSETVAVTKTASEADSSPLLKTIIAELAELKKTAMGQLNRARSEP